MMHRINAAVLGLACLALFALSPSAGVVSAQIADPDAGATLQLTTTLIRQSYCQSDDDLDSVRLEMWFKFTNTSNTPLILQKGNNLVVHQTVSRNKVDAAAKLFETGASITWLSSEGDGHCYQGGKPTSCFVILPPGKSYRLRGAANVFAVRDETKQISGAVGSGEHVIEVMVPIWPESTELGNEVRDRWRASGLLWFKSVTSDPMPFTIAAQRKVAACR
jgi:hypothetical protein